MAAKKPPLPPAAKPPARLCEPTDEEVALDEEIVEELTGHRRERSGSDEAIAREVEEIEQAEEASINLRLQAIREPDDDPTVVHL